MISRRRLLVSATGALGAALPAGTAPATAAVPDASAGVAASPALLAAIEHHRRAYASWMAVLAERRALDDEHYAESVAIGAWASLAELRALAERQGAEPRQVRIDEAEREAVCHEGEAMEAVLDMLVFSLSDLVAKFSYLQALPEDDVAYGGVDDPASRLVRSIRIEGLALPERERQA